MKTVKRDEKGKIIKDDEGKAVLTGINLFKIRFAATEVPEKATMWCTAVYLKPYVDKPRRCAYCQRYGHIARFCKDKFKQKQMCGGCAKEHEEGYVCKVSKDDVQCINCKRAKLEDLNHEVGEPKCPIFILNKDIKTAMATHNVNQKKAFKLLEENGGVSPMKKKENKTFAQTAASVDLRELIDSAKMKKNDLHYNEEEELKNRFREKKKERQEEKKTESLRTLVLKTD